MEDFQPLKESELPKDPVLLFKSWLKDAQDCVTIRNPEAMSISTIDSKGLPNARMVLLKPTKKHPFLFFTSLASPKAKELEHTPYTCLTFYWGPLGRQVRVWGRVSPISDTDADAYFASRPRMSQMGACVSKQSDVVDSREVLESDVAKLEKRYLDKDIPRPKDWSGFSITPDRIEFWQERAYRLHDRFLYCKTDRQWSIDRLYP